MAKNNFKLPNMLPNNQDHDDEIADDNVANYKGVFFGDETEQIYYEFGAHFEFKDLCKRLEKLTLILSHRNDTENKITASKLKENGNINNIKQNDASRNKNVIAGKNTLKTANFTKIANLDQSKNVTKSSLLNNHLYRSNSNLNNGGETKFNLIVTNSNFKNENIFNKPLDNSSKLGLQRRKQEEQKKSDKSSLLSSINKQTSKEKFDINKTIYNNNNFKNTSNNNSGNYFFKKIDPKNKSKYFIFNFLA